MGSPTATVLRKAIRSVAAADEPAVTDRELLRRFVEDADQAAFAGLVARHTGMVLGVCRRTLANRQDAEDAFQATFLILARKAKQVGWRSSVANWLYATARKVAHNARVAAERRAKREARAATTATVPPVDRMTGRELLAVLDEQLDRLPPGYREPLILCYLEGLTRDEAAARLGIAVDTLKVRIHRGRKRLHDALTKGGCALGAGLLALAATSPAGASPPRLVEAIRAAAAGKVPPTVAALAKGAAVNGVMKKVVLGLIALVAVAGVGIGLGEPRVSTAGPQPEKAMPAKADKDRPAEKAADDKTRVIAGTVVGPAGKPVAGAEIISLPQEAGMPAVVGKTSEDGTFSVTVSLKNWSFLFPRAAGLAPDQFLIPSIDTPAEVTFKMVKDTPIRGRVLDTQGKPVAGAAVAVRSIQGFANDSLDGFLAGFQKRPADGYPPGGKWSAQLNPRDRKPAEGDPVYAASTDKDGRFTIDGVGSERVAYVYVAGTGIAATQVVVLTRAGFDPTPYNRETLEKIKSPYSEIGFHPMLYPPDTVIVAEAEKPIRGVVKETATGKPRAGVAVTLRERRNHRMPDLRATTDADGRYEIHGAKKADRYELSVKRDPETGFIGRTVTVKDTPAYEPITADVGVTKGIVLTGRLLDDQTGEPMPGFVCVGVLYDNEAAKMRPEFDSPDCYDFAPTGKDGMYRTVVPPGPVLLMAGINPTGGKLPTEARYRMVRKDPDYPDYFDKHLSGFRSGSNTVTVIQGQWCKVLKLKPDQAEVTFDVRFQRAAEFAVKVRDADGKPVSKVVVAGHTSRDWGSPDTFESDTCTVYELDTAKPRFVVLLEPGRKLVGTLTLKGDEKEPAVVTLGRPGRVKGKLVNSAGEPIANTVVNLGYEHRPADEINHLVNGDWRSTERRIETNAAGEFAIDTVIPGEK
ncbi:MAG: sigma-70 family RNA polymerase sigma factor, partial [Zavarzinella sp.]|nr:sigma-70 family RNA polymerase sigma factor [Zavarzinella sp.]